MTQLSERVAKLESERKGAGKPPEPRDTLRENAVFSEFTKAVLEAQTAEKRHALVNVAARQFDPDVGEPATRAYWFARVRALSDVQVRLVQLMAEHTQIAFTPLGIMALKAEPTKRLDMPREASSALAAAANELLLAPTAPLIMQAQGTYALPGESFTRSGGRWVLSDDGQIVAELIQD